MNLRRRARHPRVSGQMKEAERIVSGAYLQIAERYLEWRGWQPRDEELARWP
jgi:DUF1680 family protein